MYELMTLTQRRNQYQTSKEPFIEFGHATSSFKALDSPPSTKIQAIWADLLVIEQSSQPEILINAWQSTPSTTYDFSLGRDKIVVKYASSEDRSHGFTLDQIRPSVHSHILVASTVIREAGSCAVGLSAKDLYARILQRVTAADSRLRLYSLIAQTIGSDASHFEGTYFVYPSAVDYLEFYDSADVPCIDRKYIPPQVSDISFSSNLCGLTDVRRGDGVADLAKSPLFRGLV